MVLLSGHFSKPIVVGQPNDASGQGIATSLHVEHGYDALVLAVPVYDLADTWWDVASDPNACMPMPQYRVLQPVSYRPALVIKTAILSNDGGWNHFTVLAQNNPESEGDESFDGCVLFDLAVVNPRTGAEIYSFSDGVTPNVCELFFFFLTFSLFIILPPRLTNFYLFLKNTHISQFLIQYLACLADCPASECNDTNSESSFIVGAMSRHTMANPSHVARRVSGTRGTIFGVKLTNAVPAGLAVSVAFTTAPCSGTRGKSYSSGMGAGVAIGIAVTAVVAGIGMVFLWRKARAKAPSAAEYTTFGN
jgi:hypothetical protein